MYMICICDCVCICICYLLYVMYMLYVLCYMFYVICFMLYVLCYMLKLLYVVCCVYVYILIHSNVVIFKLDISVDLVSPFNEYTWADSFREPRQKVSTQGSAFIQS